MPRNNLSPVDVTQFYNGLTPNQRGILPFAAVNNFVTRYQNGDSLVKFLKENSTNRRQFLALPFNDFVGIAFVLAQLINRLHGIVNDDLTNPQTSLSIQVPPIRDVARPPSLIAMVSEIAFLMYTQSQLMKAAKIDDAPLNFIFWFLIATVGNLKIADGSYFLQPPTVMMNAESFPSSYRPKSTDSPGITAYKEVLRLLHVVLHLYDKDKYINSFNGEIRHWFINRDMQWAATTFRLSHRCAGNVMSFPMKAPHIAWYYERDRNNAMLLVQLDDVNSETNNAEFSHEFRNQILNLINFAWSSYFTYQSDTLKDKINDTIAPSLNEQVHTLVHLFLSAATGLAVMAASREIAPVAAKKLASVTPAPVKDMLTRASGVVSNQFHYLWNRGLTVIGIQAQQNARPVPHLHQ